MGVLMKVARVYRSRYAAPGISYWSIFIGDIMYNRHMEPSMLGSNCSWSETLFKDAVTWVHGLFPVFFDHTFDQVSNI